jgi:hypothetical protein
MFTEAEFSVAMERAVARRGADWQYPEDRNTRGFYFKGVPTYADERGNATCLIGAAMHELGMQLPMPGTMGSAVMALDQRVPYHVMVAARIAQIHQDASKPWGEALAMYRAALRMAKRGHVSHFMVNDFYYEVRRAALGEESMKELVGTMHSLAEGVQKTVNAMNALDEMIAQKPEPLFASGGWVAPSEVVWSYHEKPTFEFTFEKGVVTPELFATLVGMPLIKPTEKVVLTKGAHALTA